MAVSVIDLCDLVIIYRIINESKCYFSRHRIRNEFVYVCVCVCNPRGFAVFENFSQYHKAHSHKHIHSHQSHLYGARTFESVNWNDSIRNLIRHILKRYRLFGSHAIDPLPFQKTDKLEFEKCSFHARCNRRRLCVASSERFIISTEHYVALHLVDGSVFEISWWSSRLVGNAIGMGIIWPPAFENHVI